MHVIHTVLLSIKPMWSSRGSQRQPEHLDRALVITMLQLCTGAPKHESSA
jgi:hypothetical protein